jgi:hypothetical protein
MPLVLWLVLTALQSVTRKLDDVLTANNEQISELRYEIQKLAKVSVLCACARGSEALMYVAV